MTFPWHVSLLSSSGWLFQLSIHAVWKQYPMWTLWRQTFWHNRLYSLCTGKSFPLLLPAPHMHQAIATPSLFTGSSVQETHSNFQDLIKCDDWKKGHARLQRTLSCSAVFRITSFHFTASNANECRACDIR